MDARRAAASASRNFGEKVIAAAMATPHERRIAASRALMNTSETVPKLRTAVQL
jgi:hypothetical protein